MSINATNWVFNNSILTGHARMVLTIIADKAGKHGGHSYPSRETIALESGASPSTVKRAIKEAEKAGELLVFAQAGGTVDCPSDKRPNLYGLPMVPGYELPHGLAPRVVSSDLPDNESGGSNWTPAGVQPDPSGGSKTAARGSMGEPQTSKTPLNTPKPPIQAEQSREATIEGIVSQILADRVNRPPQSMRALIDAVDWARSQKHSPADIIAAGLNAKAWSRAGFGVHLPDQPQPTRPQPETYIPPTETPRLPKEQQVGVLASARAALNPQETK